MSKKSKGDAPVFESPEELARQREAEAIAIPKGQSKFKTILVWSAMIFGCLAFAMTGPMLSTFEGGPDSGGAHLSWKGMDGEPRSLDINEFFAKRQLVTIFSAPNYCGEFDNAGAMMTVRDDLMCSFQLLKPSTKKK